MSFVTNRGGNDKKEFDATVRNLKQQHIYFDQVLFSNEDDGKEQFNKIQDLKLCKQENIIKI